ncbi:hypothetical protein Tco_0280980 [Tanacetum coccineum]
MYSPPRSDRIALMVFPRVGGRGVERSYTPEVSSSFSYRTVPGKSMRLIKDWVILQASACNLSYEHHIERPMSKTIFGSVKGSGAGAKDVSPANTVGLGRTLVRNCPVYLAELLINRCMLALQFFRYAELLRKRLIIKKPMGGVDLERNQEEEEEDPTPSEITSALSSSRVEGC